MTSVRYVSRRQLITAGVALLALPSLGACSKDPPPEATAALETALKAFAAKNEAGAIATMPAAQQAGAATTAEWPFFKAIKSYSLGDSAQVEDASVNRPVIVYFDDAKEKFSSVTCVVTKATDGWKFDLAETVAMAKRINGANAFSVYEFE